MSFAFLMSTSGDNRVSTPKCEQTTRQRLQEPPDSLGRLRQMRWVGSANGYGERRALLRKDHRQQPRVAHTDFMCNSHREDFDKSGNPLPARSPRDCPTRTDSKAQIVIPPSMTSSVPMTKDETSDERYSTASAISSGSAIRFTSVWFCNHSFV